MNKNYCYPPTLNSLFLQNKNYKRHRDNLERSKSNYDAIRDLSNQPKQSCLEEGEKSRLSGNSPIRAFQERALLGVRSNHANSILNSRKTPHERRKFSERQQQNVRILLAIQSRYKTRLDRNPSTYSYDHRRQQAREVLKERISKFAREGSSVKYKFKQSLVEIERRKEDKRYQQVERPVIHEDIHEKLLALQKRRCNTTFNLAPCADMYCLNDTEDKKKELPNIAFKLPKASHSQLGQSVAVSQESTPIELTPSKSLASFAANREALQQAVMIRMKQKKKKKKLWTESAVVLRARRAMSPPDMQIISLPSLKQTSISEI